MQNNRKPVAIALIVIGLVIIGLIIYFGFIRETEEEPGVIPGEQTPSGQLPTGPETGTTTPSDRPVSETQYDIAKEQEHAFNSADLAKRAMLYSERLGSYSSQSDYGNFTDLKIYMTEAMRDWVDEEVLDLQAKNRNKGYYGIETKALTSDLKSFDDKAGQAEIAVVTERRESTATVGGGESFRQAITIRFAKVGGDWLIDGAYWE